MLPDCQPFSLNLNIVTRVCLRSDLQEGPAHLLLNQQVSNQQVSKSCQFVYIDTDNCLLAGFLVVVITCKMLGSPCSHQGHHISQLSICRVMLSVFSLHCNILKHNQCKMAGTTKAAIEAIISAQRWVFL